MVFLIVTGPYLMGWTQGESDDFRVGLRLLAASAICSGVIVLTVRTGTQNASRPRSESTVRP